MSQKQTPIISEGRGMMKVYAARDYKDINRRTSNIIQVNLPEYLPTVPKDDKYSELSLNPDYFVNKNFPISANIIKSPHYLELPLLPGTTAPVRFNKGAEFLLFYPTGKIEEGYLIFMKDKENDKS